MQHPRLSRAFSVFLSVSCVTIVACGSAEEPPTSNGPTPDKYGSSKGVTTVIGDGKGGFSFLTPDGKDDCIDVAGTCVKPQEKCGPDARADVIVDSAGNVVDVICYPNDGNPPVVDGDGDVDLDKKNKGSVAVDGNDDGVDIAGNVSSAGNNVTVYGEGPDVSVIGGNVTATGNNFVLRGVTVKGNAEITANNGAIVLSVIEGDVIYTGNNFIMAETVVLGNVRITGNNARLVGNLVAGTITIDGKESLCDGNHTRLADGTVGETLTCNAR